MRLDRFLSQGTGMPRSEAVQRIRRGEVQLGGQVVRDSGAQVITGKDVIWRGLQVRPYGHVHVVLNKPQGLISSTDDGDGATVLSAVPEPLRHKDLAPVGRLDKDTTGLLILTTDGGLQHLLTHPKRHLDKQYLATLEQPLAADAVDKFATGLELADGTVCQPAGLLCEGTLQVRVTLREGKYHQVKRMVAACGSSVVTLHRERIGPLWLPSDLLPGTARRLTDPELATLLAAVTETKVRTLIPEVLAPGTPVAAFQPPMDPGQTVEPADA
jgi:16S rRNA pseudouridine516 synthase